MLSMHSRSLGEAKGETWKGKKGDGWLRGGVTAAGAGPGARAPSALAGPLGTGVSACRER
jgi:hypothetical protein